MCLMCKKRYETDFFLFQVTHTTSDPELFCSLDLSDPSHHMEAITGEPLVEIHGTAVGLLLPLRGHGGGFDLPLQWSGLRSGLHC